jgi:hypothetical protein
VTVASVLPTTVDSGSVTPYASQPLSSPISYFATPAAQPVGVTFKAPYTTVPGTVTTITPGSLVVEPSRTGKYAAP